MLIITELEHAWSMKTLVTWKDAISQSMTPLQATLYRICHKINNTDSRKCRKTTPSKRTIIIDTGTWSVVLGYNHVCRPHDSYRAWKYCAILGHWQGTCPEWTGGCPEYFWSPQPITCALYHTRWCNDPLPPGPISFSTLATLLGHHYTVL